MLLLKRIFKLIIKLKRFNLWNLTMTDMLLDRDLTILLKLFLVSTIWLQRYLAIKILRWRKQNVLQKVDKQMKQYNSWILFKLKILQNFTIWKELLNFMMVIVKKLRNYFLMDLDLILRIWNVKELWQKPKNVRFTNNKEISW